MKRRWYRFLYIRSPLVKILLGIVGVMLSIAVLLFLGLIEDRRMSAQTANWEGRSIEKGAEIYANNCASCHGPDGKGATGVAPALHSRYFFTQRLKDLEFTGSLHDYVALTVAAGRPSIKKSQWAQMMPTWSVDYGGPLRMDQVENVTNFVLNWEADALTQGTAENPDPWQHFENAPSRATADGGQPAAVETPVPTGPRPPQELFVSMGCVGCHNLNAPQTASERGPIGPNMGNLHETAGTRVPGQDAQTYVHNSIVNPMAFVAENYQPLMPGDFAQKMSEEEINALVAWILDPNRPQ